MLIGAPPQCTFRPIDHESRGHDKSQARTAASDDCDTFFDLVSVSNCKTTDTKHQIGLQRTNVHKTYSKRELSSFRVWVPPTVIEYVRLSGNFRRRRSLTPSRASLGRTRVQRLIWTRYLLFTVY